MIVSIKSLTKQYNGLVALDNISLDIQEGEFLALLGPSGCGKTTLLRTIAGLVSPTSGEIIIDGINVSDVPPYRRPVNTVFQSYALFPHMTVSDNVAYGPRRHGLPAREVQWRVSEALKLVGLDHLMARYPAQLSGGQQQRVALARAIANRPKVLLLDEPLAALDLQLRKQMQLELKHLQEKLGLTFVLVTHDQEEALVMADRIAVMNSARIVQLGRGEDIYWRPASRFVATFIGNTNLIDCVLDNDGLVSLDGGHVRFKPQGNTRQKTARLTMSVRPEDIQLGAGSATSDICVRAIVREKVFKGSNTHVYAATEAGTELVFAPSSTREAAALREGESLYLHWSVDSVALLDG